MRDPRLRALTLVLLLAAPALAQPADSLIVEGRSMEPILYSAYRYALEDTGDGLQRGDVVLIWGLVKQVTAVEGDTVYPRQRAVVDTATDDTTWAGRERFVVVPRGRVWLEAGNPMGRDSRRIGTVPRREIEARVVVVPRQSPRKLNNRFTDSLRTARAIQWVDSVGQRASP